MKLKDILQNALRISKWILLLLATISGYMSYRGVLTLTDDVVISAVYAVGVGGVIYLLGMVNLIILPVLSPHNRRGLPWLAYCLSILIAILISSYTNLVGITGDPVMTLDARHHVESIQQIISQTSISAQTAQNTASSLRAEQARFLALAKKEEASGTISGSKGAGVITGVFLQAANVMEVAAKALESKKEDLDAILRQANAILLQMRDLLDEDKDIEIKTLELATLNRKLQSAYEKLAATNLHQVIENTLGSLDNIIAVSTSKNNDLRATQESVIERIREDLRQTKERYTAEKQASGHDIPIYPVWEPRFQTRLLLDYALNIIPYIFAAISIDSSIFVIALLLIAMHREIAEDEADAILEGRKYSLQELDETLKLLNRLKSSDKEDNEL